MHEPSVDQSALDRVPVTPARWLLAAFSWDLLILKVRLNLIPDSFSRQQIRLASLYRVSQYAQRLLPPDPNSIYKSGSDRTPRIYRRFQYKTTRAMDDLEADQMFRLEGFDALCLSHNPDTDHRLVNIDDSATVKAERCEVIHNHATEVNLLARAMSPNQSTTVSACRKSFLDLPGGSSL